MEYRIQDWRNRSGKRSPSTRRIRIRRRLPVKACLSSRPEWKPIIVQNLYAKLKNIESWEKDDYHNMIKVVLEEKVAKLSINAMMNQGATEDFIDKEACNKH